MRLVFEVTQEGKELLTEETGVEFRDLDLRSWMGITAYNDHGAAIGVLACEPRTAHDWHFNCAIVDQRVMNARLLKTIFVVLFDKLNAVRVTAYVSPYNKRALSQMKRLGFVYEGFGRLMVNGNRDAAMFGMLRDDCPWLPGYSGGTIITRDHDGQPAQSA